MVIFCSDRNRSNISVKKQKKNHCNIRSAVPHFTIMELGHLYDKDVWLVLNHYFLSPRVLTILSPQIRIKPLIIVHRIKGSGWDYCLCWDCAARPPSASLLKYNAPSSHLRFSRTSWACDSLVPRSFIETPHEDASHKRVFHHPDKYRPLWMGSPHVTIATLIQRWSSAVLKRLWV